MLGGSYRPDAIGTPFAISGPGYYTDATTQDRLNIGFRQPIDPSWSPPKRGAQRGLIVSPPHSSGAVSASVCENVH